jgi:transketolase
VTGDRKTELEQLALRVREHILGMATGGGCFIGASLSCTDLIVYLYSQVLQVSPASFLNTDRDYLLLSKGHDVPALYGTLAELGFFEKSRLANHLKTSDSLYWHPNRSIPGVEFHSGSLGHLLSVGIGIAIDIRLRNKSNRVFVLAGDGEMNEGSMWEACLVAAALKLGNLFLIIDRNEFQANVKTEELIPLEPLGAKLESFGWHTARVDGHDFEELEKGFDQLSSGHGLPGALIATTVRGKGLPSIEKRADRWFVNFTAEEVEMLIKELHGEEQARLKSETLMVR